VTENEWKTRKERIDKKLKALKPPWDIIKYSERLDTKNLQRCAVEEFPTAKGPADYALFVKGRLLGIIEAKKVGVGPYNVLEQAKRYARGIFQSIENWDGYRVPFLYATNGEIIWHIDIRDEKNLSRQLSGFHTAEALEEFLENDVTSRYAHLKDTPIDIEGIRPYQEKAVKAIETAISQGKRSMLVAMATGTGKTFLTVSQIYRLLQAKCVRRVLFLVDRRALAAQAVREFASFNTPGGHKFDQEYEVYSQRFRREDFDEDRPFDPKVLPNAYLTAPQASHTFVYVSTIQRMAINLFGHESAFSQSRSDPDYEDDAGKLDIPIHAFDLIIADECHRGYTARDDAVWRSVMNHFDAVKIGLTATPALHTLSLFKEVICRYPTEEAVLDGWLVDYEAVKIKSDVRMQGAFLKEGERVGIIDTDTGLETFDRLEDERQYATEEIEVKITSPDSNRKIIKEIARYAHAHEKEYGRFPKMLIFASNDLPHTSHADQIVKICREEFGQGDAFVQKITGSPTVDRPLQKIREFRNRPNPRIVVTVDMLSTGVDIPALEFIVFMRPVKSRILWVQMLGRGTRKCDLINKEKFVIFDCFDGTLIEYFKDTTDFDVQVSSQEPVPIAQVIENIYQNIDRDYYTKVLVKRLHRIDRTMSGKARERFAAFIPDGDLGKFAKDLPGKIKNNFANTLALLRNKDFQDLLVNYERAKRSFVVGYEIEDTVSSDVMIRLGPEYQKPEDYLQAFTRFVKENPEKIEAIKILTERPKQWNAGALKELRVKLNLNKYPEKELQKAHQLVYKKALADIISMVKHAAREEEPITSAKERVDRAVAKVTAGVVLTDEQQKWLEYIRSHLIENLTINLEDFDTLPVFERHGGRTTADRIFNNELEKWINDINYAIAA